MSALFSEIENCVTAPQGFRAGTAACGIKSSETVKDLSIVVSDVPCVAVGVFTTSTTRAAPVLLCQERLKNGRAQAVIVNSGNANCATGELGLLNANRMTELAAMRLGLESQMVLCSSTGIIGRQLPMDKIEHGIKAMKLGREQGNAFSEAILTTDTHPKRMALQFEIDGHMVRLGGVTKGAGMIYPNMATMLCYLTTDAALEFEWIQAELRAATEDTFNMLSVDGDMSTNDTCILLANGLVGNTPISASHPEAADFRHALRHIMTYLAREMARDGEGASKLMTVYVRGARDKTDAIKAARAITASPLWQCSLAGADPNWGRIVSALGASGCELHQDRYEIFISDVQVAKHGMAVEYDDARAHAAMASDEVTISIDLHIGTGQATAWGCDLTHDYIDENTLYTC
ncbi:MAG: bifunctional glutamate N-acetyltransferase/amino-acid acetyltransferase ArgJ [Ktedonobacteraceae bacterium]|nr:bifunctional glutamate N-acetyltransferase/amino-acid acetyltransferase ArgJ [Ktedonobacteraceae bacterium]